MFTHKYLLAIGLFSLAFVGSSTLFAQATGSISGTVTDSTGSAVPGAKVTVSRRRRALPAIRLPTTKGHYLVPLVGRCELQRSRGAARDFRPPKPRTSGCKWMNSANWISSSRRPSVKQSVEVTATAVAVQTTELHAGSGDHLAASRRACP